jgi:release factor glutamine methyltransferase
LLKLSAVIQNQPHISSMGTYETLRERVAGQLMFLPDKPEETVDSTLRALWFAAAGMPRSAQLSMLGELPRLDSQQQELLERFVARRIDGVPLAHISERQRFMDMEMLAGPEALVPRKETELLAHTAVRLAREIASQRGKVCVVDVCTGSGNVALAIAHHVPQARIFAADISEAAIGLAQRNADELAFSDRVEFRAGDLLTPFDIPELVGKVDLLTCNPPYINTAKVARMPVEIAAHEPRLAFDGGALGIAILMRLIEQAPRFLRPEGWLAFEVGHGQGPALVKRMKGQELFADVGSSQDSEGTARVLFAQRRASQSQERS